jgi:hypothetical protein
LRDGLAHAYFGGDDDIVWSTQATIGLFTSGARQTAWSLSSGERRSMVASTVASQRVIAARRNV